MRIYNLHPYLAGEVNKWTSHVERAASLGFNWILLNPVFHIGESNNLYAIHDYFSMNRRIVSDGSFSPLKKFITQCHDLGLQVMVEVDLSHFSVDSEFVTETPTCFLRKPDGGLVHPRFYEEWKARDELVDLAMLDEDNCGKKNMVSEYRSKILSHCFKLGFDGIKILNVCSLKPENLKKILRQFKKGNTPPLFVGDTLGATIDQVLQYKNCGLDLIYNSSKFWDFKEAWCTEQYALTRHFFGSVSFPENCDTERLLHEVGGDVRMVKLRYLLASLFSQAVMIPIGFEYGFRKRLHARTTTSADWEGININLTSYIRRVNELKRNFTIFQEESPFLKLEPIPGPVITLLKESNDGNQRCLIIMNTDPWSYHQVTGGDMPKILGKQIIDLSPEYSMDGIAENFNYFLRPGEVKLLYAEKKFSNYQLKLQESK